MRKMKLTFTECVLCARGSTMCAHIYFLSKSFQKPTKVVIFNP